MYHTCGALPHTPVTFFLDKKSDQKNQGLHLALSWWNFFHSRSCDPSGDLLRSFPQGTPQPGSLKKPDKLRAFAFLTKNIQLVSVFLS